MSKTIIATVIFISGFSIFSFAGESGYVLHGKSTVVYRDGEKVGEWPSQQTADTSSQKGRKPAATPAQSINVLTFEDDGNVRCYGWGLVGAVGMHKFATDSASGPFCVKK